MILCIYFAGFVMNNSKKRAANETLHTIGANNGKPHKCSTCDRVEGRRQETSDDAFRREAMQL